MTHELLDDYMADMLGAPPPTPARPAPALASVPTPPAAEALPSAPAPVETVPAPEAVAPPPAAAPLDMVAELMAEFDAEVGAATTPKPAAAPAPAPAPAPLDMVAELMAEFDAEVGTPAAAPPAAAPAFSMVDDLLAEFDAEVARSGDPVPPAAPAAPAAAPPKAAPPAAAPVATPATPEAPRERRRREDVIKRWLRFTVGEQSYAVEVLKVQEVMRVPEVLPLRGAEPALQGVMNLRGLIVPVIDLGIRLGTCEVVPDALSRVVVLECDGEAMGILVSTVAEVMAISEAHIEHPRNLNCGLNCESLTGVCRQADSLTVLLDASILLQ